MNGRAMKLMAGVGAASIVIVAGLRLGEREDRSGQTLNVQRSTLNAQVTDRRIARGDHAPTLNAERSKLRRRESAALQKSEDLKKAVAMRLERLRERQTGDEETRVAMMRELQAALTDDNAAEICRGLSAEDLRSDFATLALAKWLAVDPMAAAAWVASHPELAPEQAAEIGRKLGADAFDRVDRALADGSFKQTMLDAAALGSADRDPARAMTLALRLTSSEAQTSALETITYAWAVRDSVGAERWIAAVNDPALRGQLLLVGAKALAATDPDQAASWLTATGVGGAAAEQAIVTIAEGWSTKDPAKAAAWVGGLPASGARDASAIAVLRQWSVSDPDAATAWLMTLPEREKVMERLKGEKEERASAKD